MHLYTIGHSNRTLGEFVSLLSENGVKVLVDVRSWPSSKSNPQFSQEALRETLQSAGIKYVWLGKELGGYRNQGLGEGSPNKAWRSKGFRNYADHTYTEEFITGIRKLLSISENEKTAYMCAERFYWRCHRRIISDYLKTKGHQITHIIDKEQTREHELTSFAKIENGKLTYPKQPLKPTTTIHKTGKKKAKNPAEAETSGNNSRRAESQSRQSRTFQEET
jgi:uncharacterized protein (DUF488 family)